MPSDIQAVVYCAGVRNGDADVFEFIFQRYDAAVVGTQKTRLLNALVCYADLTLIEMYASQEAFNLLSFENC